MEFFAPPDGKIDSKLCILFVFLFGVISFILFSLFSNNVGESNLITDVIIKTFNYIRRIILNITEDEYLDREVLSKNTLAMVWNAGGGVIFGCVSAISFFVKSDFHQKFLSKNKKNTIGIEFLSSLVFIITSIIFGRNIIFFDAKFFVDLKFTYSPEYFERASSFIYFYLNGFVFFVSIIFVLTTAWRLVSGKVMGNE